MNGDPNNQELNITSPDAFLKKLIMKSNEQTNYSSQQQQQQQQQQQHPQQIPQQSIHFEQQSINSLGSIPISLLQQNSVTPSIIQNQNFQNSQQLNPSQLQQLLLQQQLKQQHLQHQLIEERLLQQSKVQQQQKQAISQDYLFQQSQIKNIPSNNQEQQMPLNTSQSTALYSINLQNIQQDQQEQQTKRPSFHNKDDTTILSSLNYLPGTASLIEYIDKQLMVVLRDGKTLIGFLRSIDQYANLLLSKTFERIHVNNKYADIQRGICVVRGENVVLLGEIDLTMPLKVSMEQVSEREILELQSTEQKKQEEAEKAKKKALLERCLIPNTDTMLDEYY